MAYKIWNDSTLSVPTIYLHSFQGDGADVWEEAHKLGCPSFNLVSIHDIELDAALTPWPAEGVRRDQSPFGGKATKHLDEILHTLLPEVERQLPAPSSYLVLAGYSLAGLFALWAATETPSFRRLACVSASFWYPGFAAYFQEKGFALTPEAVYFSLGVKESQTKHPLMRQVEKITETLYRSVEQQSIPTCFIMNPGNHFTEPNTRMAKALYWLLTQ